MLYKTCFKCKVRKPVDTGFYVHGGMTDGHLNKCKTCVKAYARSQDRREYDKQREHTERRKQWKLVYQQKTRAMYPGKNTARHAVSNGIRDGKVKRLPCEVCGETKSEAHHTDYRKYLDVRWLCFKHHREAEGRLVAA